MRQYMLGMHPSLAFNLEQEANMTTAIHLPNDLAEDKNALSAMIDADPVLQELYSDKAFVLEFGGELVPLASQLLKDRVTWYTLAPGDQLVVHVQRTLFDAQIARVFAQCAVSANAA